MKYNPHFHNRQSIRKQGYDYRHSGGYFVTICVREPSVELSHILGGAVQLTDYGRIVQQEWHKTAQIRPYVDLDVFAVMPDHFHGILWIAGNPDTATLIQRNDVPNGRGEILAPAHATGLTAKSLGSIIGTFKAAVTRRINRMCDTHEYSIWQRNYYEHIIRDAEDYQGIKHYILTNPNNWAKHEHGEQ